MELLHSLLPIFCLYILHRSFISHLPNKHCFTSNHFLCCLHAMDCYNKKTQIIRAEEYWLLLFSDTFVNIVILHIAVVSIFCSLKSSRLSLPQVWCMVAVYLAPGIMQENEHTGLSDTQVFGFCSITNLLTSLLPSNHPSQGCQASFTI